MSFQAMTWAVEQKLPATKKIVLLMLANRTNSDTGKCIPKIKTLAEDCGLSESSTKSAIKELAELGLLAIIPRFYDGQQLPNQYHLNPEGVGQHTTPPRQHTTQVGQQLATESGIESGIESSIKKVSKKSDMKSLAEYLTECEQAGAKPIPDGHASRKYAQSAKLDPDMLAIMWHWFCEHYTEGTGAAKKYKDWGMTFTNAVKGNWGKLWYVARDSGAVCWTSEGLLFKASVDAKIGA